MLKRNVLKKIVKDNIIELFKARNIIVDKIIFFGSFVRGKTKQDSDIDIIVVSHNFRDKDLFERVELTKDIDRELVKRFNKPFDLLYYSDIEWEKGHSLIITAAKQKGEIVYGSKKSQ